MSLSEILELCEKHMNEGDYVKASNILKNIHNETPTPTPTADMSEIVIRNLNIELSKPCYCDLCDGPDDECDCGECAINHIEIRNSRYNRSIPGSKVYIRCYFYHSETEVDIPIDDLHKTLRMFIELNFWGGLKFKNKFFQVILSESYYNDSDIGDSISYIDYAIEKIIELM
jgi:hypothetical protein